MPCDQMSTRSSELTMKVGEALSRSISCEAGVFEVFGVFRVLEIRMIVGVVGVVGVIRLARYCGTLGSVSWLG